MKNIWENGKTDLRIALWVPSLLIILASTILVYSFVSIDIVGKSSVVQNDTISDNLSTDGPRMVFVVIDAFRLSFLTSPNSPMKFLRESIENQKAAAFDAFARMPTVTLPRITSFITGTLPSFGTILTNLATDEIQLDNWVTRLRTNGKRIHFYGDDTWIKLLPGQFEKFEGVTSFFVSDYTEVDNNVTRHLTKELRNKEWDALILHYLGLDHIGHSLGGTSPKINKKLIEMDDIIKDIYKKLNGIANEKLYIVVCGDHGMTQAGSHGGASSDETRVPVVIFPPMGTNVLNKDIKNLERIEQIDLASTIFSIFGMKHPATSYGVSLVHKINPISDVTAYWHEQYETFKLIADENHLTLSISCSETDSCDFSKKTIQDILEKEFRRIQSKLAENSAQLPNDRMFISVFILATAGIIAVCSQLSKAGILSCLINFICFSSSFIEEEHEVWYYASSSVLIFHLFNNLRRKNYKNVQNILTIAIAHRLCFGWTQSIRRRWEMEQNLLPPSVFSEIFNLDVVDINTFFINNQILGLICSLLAWLIFLPNFKNSLYLLLPYLVHIFRIDGHLESQAIFLKVFRVLCLPGSNALSTPIIGTISLVICIMPTSQLFLAALIYLIGRKAGELKDFGDFEAISLLTSAFYYTGNSNSLSTLSLTAGYTGLTDYNPILVGVQLFLNTYAGPIIFLCGWGKPIRSYQLFRTSSLITSLICLYIFQHHLFVWSVYAPKVVYDLFTCIFTIGIHFVHSSMKN